MTPLFRAHFLVLLCLLSAMCAGGCRHSQPADGGVVTPTGSFAGASVASCPADMALIPGGETTVVYTGERWGGRREEKVALQSFCLDIYEASQPDATADSMGSWSAGMAVPAATSRRGVLPWMGITWNEAAAACRLAGKRLPTLAEWQTAFSGYDGAPWPWPGDYHENTCHIGYPQLRNYPTGGCCYSFEKNSVRFETCDMLGNLAEWLDGYWDVNCYRDTQVVIANAAAVGPGLEGNHQAPDPDRAGCWRFIGFGHPRSGLHHHGKDERFDDDGFRCAASLAAPR